MFFHLDFNKGSLFTISASFAFTMFGTLQSEIVAITIFLLTTALLAVTTFK
jgi:hypothetical protein